MPPVPHDRAERRRVAGGRRPAAAAGLAGSDRSRRVSEWQAAGLADGAIVPRWSGPGPGPGPEVTVGPAEPGPKQPSESPGMRRFRAERGPGPARQARRAGESQTQCPAARLTQFKSEAPGRGPGPSEPGPGPCQFDSEFGGPGSCLPSPRHRVTDTAKVTVTIMTCDSDSWAGMTGEARPPGEHRAASRTWQCQCAAVRKPMTRTQ